MMSKIDELIDSALEKEDRDLFAQLDGDMNLIDMAASVFQGKLRWLSIMMSVWILVLTLLGIYCAWQFFAAELTRELLIWAVGFGFCLMAIMVLKLWFWLEIQKNAVLREVKRVELQVARLHQFIAAKVTV
ncbi:MAG: DUF6768 family protein [Xanthomonadales bacterium]|nr:DUF6768 family protein [Xanthomonadales bacterium]